MINKKYKFLFIHNKKCAGRSIKEGLLEAYKDDLGSFLEEGCKSPFLVNDIQSSNHWSLSQYKYYLKDDLKDYFKFISVRNPWDKLVSLYYFLKAVENYNKTFGIFCNERRNLLKNLTLEKKIKTKDKIDIDFVIRFENLQEDFNQCMKMIDIKNPPKLKKFDHGVSRTRGYREHYTSTTKKLVQDVFAWEIERFGYEF